MMSERPGSYLFYGILVFAAALTALVFLPELNVIVIGITLAVLFQPWFMKLRSAFHGNGGLAAGIVVVLAIILVLVPLIFFGTQVFFEAEALYKSLAAGSAAPATNWIHGEFAKAFPSENINVQSYIQQALGVLVSNVGLIVTGLIGVAVLFMLSFFALYYFLKDGDDLHATIMRWSPLPEAQTGEVLDKLHAMMSAIIRGALLIGVIYGALTGIGFAVFGLPSAILWGSVTVIASFVPWIGVFLVVGPGIATLAVEGHMFAAIGLLIWFAVMTSVIESWLRPFIIGRRARIHPLLMLFAVLGGLAFFGPIGFLLGPLALGLFLALLDSYPLFALNSLNRK